MNHITLTGRLTKDLELRSTATGRDTTMFSLAVDGGKDAENNKITDFINVSAYGERAKLVSTYCHKGDLIGVEGKLKPYVKEDDKGNKTTYYSVVIDRVEFLNTKKVENDTKEVTEEVEEEIVFDANNVNLSDDDLPF